MPGIDTARAFDSALSLTPRPSLTEDGITDDDNILRSLAKRVADRDRECVRAYAEPDDDERMLSVIQVKTEPGKRGRLQLADVLAALAKELRAGR